MWLAFIGGMTVGLLVGGLALAALDDPRDRDPRLTKLVRSVAWLSGTGALAASALFVVWVVRSIIERPSDWTALLAVAAGILTLVAWTLLRERNYYRAYSALMRRKAMGEDVDEELLRLTPPVLPAPIARLQPEREGRSRGSG